MATLRRSATERYFATAKAARGRGQARSRQALPSGQAATYNDPSDGSPDILIRDSSGNLRAFSAVCTHAGCTVGYEGGTHRLPLSRR